MFLSYFWQERYLSFNRLFLWLKEELGIGHCIGRHILLMGVPDILSD